MSAASTSREAFEKWAKRRGLSLSLFEGGYTYQETALAWGAWKNSRKQTLVKVKQVFQPAPADYVDQDAWAAARKVVNGKLKGLSK